MLLKSNSAEEDIYLERVAPYRSSLIILYCILSLSASVVTHGSTMQALSAFSRDVLHHFKTAASE